MELPLVRAVFATGELSYSKVRAITRVAQPATQAQLVELARHATGAQLDKIVRGYHRAVAATAAAEGAAHENRFVRYHWDDDGSLRLTARLPAADGALLIQALKQHEATDLPAEDADGAEHDAGATPLYAINHHDRPENEPAEARKADALTATARAALEAGTTRRTGGDPCELVVHVDVQTLTDAEVHERSEIEHGPAIPPETVRRLGCDAAVVRIIERDGQPLSVGRRTRTIPPALRRALRSRDHGCRFPGCTHQRYLHAHHITHWAHGGETSLNNLIQLCSYHHRLLHEGGYSIESSTERAGTTGPAGPRAIRFRRPNGQIIPTACQGGRTRGATLTQQHRRLGLTIDGNTCAAKSAGQPWDYHLTVDGLIWLTEQDP